jgi:DsbC/DsbD-like thiol-disulfide interchange protein
MKHLFELQLIALLAGIAPLSASSYLAQRASEVAKPGSARQNAGEIWTDHLRLRAYASAGTVAPGRPVSLVLEVEPGDRMHVYAPGNHDYRVITVTLAPQRFVRSGPVQYPASEVYLFEPLNERVPVYQKPFKLTLDVTLDRGPEARAALQGRPSLTLTGTLDYQACDDRICFNPVSIPLSWTLALSPGSAPAPSGQAPREE